MENYFNYFTEIEERFQQCRGTRTLLSPLDWALIESWKEAQLPLEAVLTGVERAFQKFRKRPKPGRMVNSLAYCAQEVLRAAEETQAAQVQGGTTQSKDARPPAPFSPEEISNFLRHNWQFIERASRKAAEHGQHVLGDDLGSAAEALRNIAEQEAGKPTSDFEDLETRLTALEEKLTASLTRASSLELLTGFRNEVEHSLAPYRRKMSAAQIESLERQFLKKRLLEHYEVPRLSLFYL